MNENKQNNNIDNTEAKKTIFNSQFLLSKDLFYDFCSVDYIRTKKIILIFLCIIISFICIDIITGDFDIILGLTAMIVSFIMFLIYIRTKKTIKIGYERMLISEGKEISVNYEFFNDKIVAYRENSIRDFSYQEITKFFETKHFIMLHLQHNLHIAIEKDNLNISVDEVKTFLINNCPNVKKKKFVNCTKNKKFALIFLIALFVVSVVGMIVGIIKLF